MNTKTTNIDQLLANLFTDKKTIYVDDIIIEAHGGCEAWWCFDYTLKMKAPEWRNTQITRQQLIDFIKCKQLNHWEAFRYDDETGNIQPIENITHDLGTFLDENYREVTIELLKDLVKKITR